MSPRRIVPFIGGLAALLLALGVYLSWRMGRKVDWPAHVAAALPALLLCGVGSYGARFLRWHVLARRLAPALGLGTSLCIYMSGFALGLTPGRLGEFLKFSLLREATGVDELESVGIFPVERATEAASFLALALFGAASGHLQLRHVGVGTLAMIGLLPCLAALPLALRLLRGRAHGAGGSPLLRRTEQVLRGLLTVAGLRALLPALLCALAARSCDLLLFHGAARAVGLALPIPAAALAWGLAGLVGGLSLLPAGVGAVEASLVATVAGLGGDGTAALAAALLARVMTLWLWIPPGLWLALRGTRRPAPAPIEARARADERAVVVAGTR